MDIAAYLAAKEMTQQTFANLVGVTQGRVSHWLTGGKIPAERCLLIEMKTEGAIKRTDLRSDIWPESDTQQKAA